MGITYFTNYNQEQTGFKTKISLKYDTTLVSIYFKTIRLNSKPELNFLCFVPTWSVIIY